MPKAPLGGNAIGDSYTYGSTVKYSCGVLYNLVGNDTSVCQANATWSGNLPRCKPSMFRHNCIYNMIVLCLLLLMNLRVV